MPGLMSKKLSRFLTKFDAKPAKDVCRYINDDLASHSTSKLFCLTLLFSLRLSLRWDVHAASLVGARAAGPAAGALPAGLRPGLRSPVHPPLWSRVQQPPAPALPGHTGATQRRVSGH